MLYLINRCWVVLKPSHPDVVTLDQILKKKCWNVLLHKKSITQPWRNAMRDHQTEPQVSLLKLPVLYIATESQICAQTGQVSSSELQKVPHCNSFSERLLGLSCDSGCILGRKIKVQTHSKKPILSKLASSSWIQFHQTNPEDKAKSSFELWGDAGFCAHDPSSWCPRPLHCWPLGRGFYLNLVIFNYFQPIVRSIFLLWNNPKYCQFSCACQPQVSILHVKQKLFKISCQSLRVLAKYQFSVWMTH